jgi:hypothetical protein
MVNCRTILNSVVIETYGLINVEIEVVSRREKIPFHDYDIFQGLQTDMKQHKDLAGYVTVKRIQRQCKDWLHTKKSATRVACHYYTTTTRKKSETSFICHHCSRKLFLLFLTVLQLLLWLLIMMTISIVSSVNGPSNGLTGLHRYLHFRGLDVVYLWFKNQQHTLIDLRHRFYRLQRSRYSDCLRPGRPKVRSSSLCSRRFFSSQLYPDRF